MTSPSYPTSQSLGIPQELREWDQWVVHRNKVPYSPRSGEMASSTDPATWASFERARAVAEHFHGMGFVFASRDPFFGIDLDKCRDPETGAIQHWALAIVQRFGTYAEVSFSGTGVHLIGRGSLPPGRRRVGGIETYDTARYFTMSGNVIEGYGAIRDCADSLPAWFSEIFPTDEQPAQFAPSNEPTLPDGDLLEQIRNSRQGPAFIALHDPGDTSAYGNDDSAADLAELNILRFWTRGDAVSMERLFNGSALANREKWQRRPDYRHRTIARALDNPEVYEPTRPGMATTQPHLKQDLPAAEHVPAPEFPIEAFPIPIRRWLDAGARSIGVPVEMVAMVFLPLVGGMIGNRLQIQLKQGFTQLPVLWVAVITDPGRGKSPALNHARRLFNRMQTKALEAYRAALADFEDEEARWKAADTDERGPKPIRPKLRHYYTTNATLEAIVGMLEASPGVTMVFDELAAYILGLGQYKSGKGSDRQEVLSAWANAGIKQDRRLGEAVIVNNVALPVAGMLTTDNLSVLHSKDGTRDGMLERFLLIRPEFDPPGWTDDEVSPDLFAPAMDLIERLDRLPPCDSDDGGVTVQLSREARNEWVAWFNENAMHQRDAKGVTAGVYSKLPQQVARIALILHALQVADDPRVMVSGETMADAIAVGEFCRAHFHRSLPLLNETSASLVGGVESRVLRILRNPQHQEREGYVSRRTLLQRLGNIKTDELTIALDALREAGRVESLIEETATKPRESWRLVTADVVEFPDRGRPVESPANSNSDYVEEVI